MKKTWTDWEVRYLREHWIDLGDKGLAERLGRSLYSVQTKRYSLGICINPAEWSDGEDAYILEHWNDQTEEQMGAELRRTAHAIHARGVSLGLLRRKPYVKGHRTWTSEEISYLRNNWGMVTMQSLCRKLNRTEAAINCKRQELGLGAFLEHGDYITLHQLLVAFTGTSASDSYKMKSGFGLSTLMSFGYGQRNTGHFWTSLKWSRWLLAKSRGGLQSSEKKTLKHLLPSARIPGHRQRIAD